MHPSKVIDGSEQMLNRPVLYRPGGGGPPALRPTSFASVGPSVAMLRPSPSNVLDSQVAADGRGIDDDDGGGPAGGGG